MQFLHFWIGFIVVLTMAGGLGGLYYLIVKQHATVGDKTIRLIAIVFVLPLLTVLGLAGILRAETIGPLIGVIIGFVLANFGNRE